MAITITMKNVRLRNGIYEFRKVIPKDCWEAVGKREHTESLKTKDPVEAATLAEPLTAEWKQKIIDARNGGPVEPTTTVGKADNTVADFKIQLDDHMEQHLADYLDQRTEGQLRNSVAHCRKCIDSIKNRPSDTMDLMNELGITLPLPKQKFPGMTRRINKAVSDALGQIIKAIDGEIGSALLPKTLLAGVQASSPGEPLVKENPAPPSVQSGMDIVEVMNLMLDSKNFGGKYRGVIEAEVKYLPEWLGAKSDITAITKADMLDCARKCLPYIPKNMQKIDIYTGKSLRECVDLVKGNLTKYVPISHQTCKNRFAKAQTVFTYAKEQLGIITINPAGGIEIPEVRVMRSTPRGLTDDEASAMWTQLNEVFSSVGQRPERYWIPILGLYHGFRLNEMCSL